MSLLDAEQSARYIDSLVASVQALEADLAATRDKLRQAQQARCYSCMEVEASLGRAQARIAALEAESDGRRRILLEKAEALRSAEIGLMRAEAEVENLQRLLAQADARGREEQ